MSAKSSRLEYLMSNLTLKGKSVKTAAATSHPLEIPSTSELRSVLTVPVLTPQLARASIGEKAWETAKAILIYQRHQHLGFEETRAAVRRDMEHGFILQEKEIPQIFANHHFFESCSKYFVLFIERNYARSLVSQLSSITTKDVLPAKLFYQIWLLSFYFEYEDIASLAHLKILSTKEYASLSVICRVIRENYRSQEFGCTPKHKCGLFEDYRSSGFFNIALCADIVMGPENGNYEVNPALYMKMITQLRASCASLDGDFMLKLVNFMTDYPKMTTEDLVKKYELDKGAEYVAWAQLQLEWEERGLIQVVACECV